MWKSAIFLAVTAHIIYTVSTEAVSNSKSFASASSSKSSSSSASSSSYSSSSSSKNSSACSATSQTTSKKPDKQKNCTRPNEVYDLCPARCPFRTCGIDDRTVRCSRPLPVGDPNCPPPACRCADGYFRDDKGNCVEWDDCPQCDNPNEEYDACPAPCPPRLCGVDESLILCQVPPQPGDPDCKPGCRCSDNYVRNDEGICIPKDQCPKCDNPNEEYDACPAPCPPRLCGVDESLILCQVPPQPGDPGCIPGCRCSDNYVRNGEGICIPKDQCPQCDNPNEEYDACPAPCPPRLCGVDESLILCQVPPQPGDPGCEPGCRCSDNYVRNDEGICIPKDQCPKCDNPNEEYDACPAPCPPRLCGVDESLILCQVPPQPGDPGCIPGCRCSDNYVRNDEGICIPKDQCPQCDNPNEEYDACPAPCPPRLCGVDESLILCQVPPQPGDPGCEPGCRCSDNYVRNDDGICIPKDQCPKCDNPNEEYDACPAPCPPRLCGVDESLILCQVPPQPGDPGCIPGCRCSDNYVRNDEGICIPKDQCPQCDNPNEEYDACPAPCPPRLCGVDESLILCQVPPQPGDPGCEPGCRCSDNYVRNDDGICIPKDQCPQCENPNEDYDACPAPCPPRLCGVDESLILCQVPPQPGDPGCEPGCRCSDNYVRNDDGICIPKDQCPQCDNPNEEYDACPAPCPPRLCGVDESLILCQVPPQPGDPGCEPGCRCSDNYVRNDDGICIPKDQCPQCVNPNEEYDACPAPCPPRLCGVDESLILCQVPPQPGDPGCIPGCRCSDNYVRNDEGICIPKDQCPQCDNPNEEYDACPATCPLRLCGVDESLILCQVPPQPGDPGCEPGCRCSDNYVRNDDGICIPKDQCPQCDNPNEEYDACPATCPLRLCGVDESLILCQVPPQPGDPGCEPGCRCSDNYVRNDDGICIPKDQYPQCDNPNEEYDACPATCPLRLCGVDESLILCQVPPQPGDPGCEPGCRCSDNYVRNDDGICIPKDQCPQCENPNEDYDACPAPCPPRLCGVDESLILCQVPPQPGDPGCEPGCRCSDNYVRNDDGICIPKDQCPQCDNPNEEYDACPAPCPPRLCGVDESLILCQVPPQPGDPGCEPGCRCSDNYVRNDDGICIPKDQCPQCVNPNEEYDACPAPCPPRLCGVDESLILCQVPPQPGDPGCIPGCRCSDNYVRNDEGICIPKDQCPQCDNPNEEYDACPATCPLRLCGVDESLILCQVPPQPGDPGCEPGCRCSDNYVRNDDGICIPKDQCPQCDNPNEEYDACPATCPLRLCGVDESLILCQVPPQPGDPGCEPGCRCSDNYVRNDDGICIPKDQCPQCDNPNEEYDACPATCPLRLCGVDESLILCQVPPQPGDPGCEPGCRCSDNYVRNDDGICIPKDQYPQCDNPNEEYDACPAPCPPRLCGVDESLILCQVPPQPGDPGCEPGCRCSDNYVRNDDGICIPKDQCPQCDNPNEEYDACPAPCPPRLCGVDESLILCQVPPQPGDPGCEPGCRCSDNYVRNDDGICIPKDQCPQCDNPNEEYDACPAPCPPRLCGVDESLILCQVPPQPGDPGCIPGCRCSDNYVRNDEGICIPKDQCPQCDNPNEEYDACPAPCPPRLCGVDESLILCQVPPQPGDPGCIPGCRCSDNYVRNDEGICIPKDQCPQCDNPNEEYDACPAPCPPRLCGVDESLILCQVPPQPGDPGCEPGCRCSDNYVRNDEGICIPKYQCPQCDNPNEEYDACPAPCPPRLCGVDESLILCQVPPQPGDPDCKPGCRCSDNYVRNDEGICIPKDQCPVSCKGDPNARPGCGVNCGRLCSNYKNDDVSCIQVCYSDGCDCKENYVLDTNIGKCVLPDQCTPTCPINEVYSSCVQRNCGAQYCANKYAVPCVPTADSDCTGGCICADNYKRLTNGTCVPEDQCEAVSCKGDPNARPGCGVNCGRLCSNYKSDDVSCIQVCYEDGCDCKEGYVLDEKLGKCVLPDQCPKKEESCGGDPNAKPGCGVNCGRLCSNYKNGDKVACPLICNVNGCDCKEGYVLDEKLNKCVLPDQCPKEEESCGGDPNAKPGCGVNCGRLCSNYKNGDQVACPAICNLNGCDCKKGYVLDEKLNKCVLPDQCPKEEESCGGDPNAKPGCGVNCGRLCSNYKNGDQVACPAICNLNGCDCKKGYVLDEKLNKCVLPDQCPKEEESCGGDPNAKPGCGVNCGRLCSNYKNADQIVCPAICNLNGCDCKEGYVLDGNIGKCVLPDQCSVDQNQCNKPNEEYQQCPDCSPGTCESIGKRYNCPLKPANSSDCTGECRCKSGYYRNKIGECITKEQCLQCNGSNEYFSCGPECDNVCANPSENKTNCPYINIQCNKKCYCEDGYARDKNNICVPIDQCPPLLPSECKENERYVECPDAECVPQTCADAGYPVPCPRIANGRCPSKPACICNSGYLRNSEDVCVPQNECPSCGGDPNARPGCGVNCGRLCSNYQNSSEVACSDICDLNGCNCIDGYVLDNNTGKCVLPEQCSSPCGENEVFSNCVNGGCDKRNCSQINDPDICIDPLKCEGGCVCQEGYLRDSNGVCIPQDQCGETCPDGETFSDCPPVYSKDCNSELCPRSRNDPPVCATTRQCGEPRCICSYLRKRNRKTGKCVLASDCPPFPCNGPNEEYDSCPPSCPGQNCSDYLNNSTCPSLFRIGIVVPCKPACRCTNNTYRNSKGICVSTAECESSTDRPRRATTDDADDNQLSNLEQGNTAFTGNFLYQVLSSNPGENLIMSPFSVLIPLAELALCANGTSLTELLNVVNLQNTDQVLSTFPNLINKLDSEQNNTLDLGARVYVNQDYQLTKNFEDDTALFGAKADTINVNDPNGAATKINDWVSNITRGEITDLVSPDVITGLTRLILANAIYFKGTWKTQFDPNNTKDQDFYVTTDDKSQVKMMNLKDKFNYTEVTDIDAKVLQLPYVGGDMSLIAILPNQIDGLVPLVEKLRNETVFNNAINSLSIETVTVSFPKMNISTTIDLKKILQQLNVTGIFNQSNSGLQGIITKNEPIYVTDAIEKSTFTADEEGSTAAAANAFVVTYAQAVMANPPEEYYFTVDHPVAFYILYNKLIIFCGTYVKP